MEKKYGYKLVHQIDNKVFGNGWFSLVINIYYLNCLKYKIGRKTYKYAKDSPIFVFDTKQNAKNFFIKECFNEEYVKLLKCEYKKSEFKIKEEKIIKTNQIEINTDFNHFDVNYFEMYAHNKKFITIYDIPDGTVLCDWVKPIEEIQF